MSEERNAAIKKGVKEDDQGCINIPCSYDMGWQKRGKGHNSSTGHAAVMGLTYGKVMVFTTRTKSCRVCTNAKKNWKTSQANTIVDSIIPHHQKQWSLWQQYICLLKA